MELIARARFKYLPRAVKWMLPVSGRADLIKLGSVYGGWVVPASLLNSASICYCAGVGEDVSFDLALIERFGCDVHAFDPTPRAVRFVQERVNEPKFHFLPVGVWSADETKRFYAPDRADNVSHSILNLRSMGDYFEAPCKSLPTLMRELGHDRIDLLKLDIEGAEYAVLDSLIEHRIQPKILAVEFDQPYPIRKTLAAARSFMKLGQYDLVSIDLWNFTFVRRGL